jgi:hypothetical protein
MLQPFSFLIVVEKAIRGNTNVAVTEGHAAVKVYSEQNLRLGHFTYLFKQLRKYIIAAHWFIVTGIRE